MKTKTKTKDKDEDEDEDKEQYRIYNIITVIILITTFVKFMQAFISSSLSKVV